MGLRACRPRFFIRGTIPPVRRPGFWNDACTGAFGGLVVGVLATQSHTRVGVATIVAMGAAGAMVRCWNWWSVVRPGRTWVRRLLHGRCPSCGYNLTGNVSGVCPECGDRDVQPAR